jgi:N-acetyl-D-muramate 6-phosphate phosphatase
MPAAGMRRVELVLFDLDGTLADTAGDLAGALNRLRLDRGLEPMPVTALRAHASSGARGLIGAGLGVHPDAPDYPALRDAFLAHYEARGLRWGIVTNKAARFTVPVVEALHLATRAATVVSGDTTPHPKPHPEPLFHAARALSLPPARCAYVGDDLRDITAGNAAGMPTLVARWGYLGTGEPHERWPATGGADDPLGLLRWLP